MRLHITPDVLGKMYFYDIMMLYHRYEEYVKEENEQQKAQEAEYEERYEDMRSEMGSVSDMSKNFNVPNYNFGNFNPANFGL